VQAINVEGLSLDKFLEHQVNNNGWALEKGGKVHSLIQLSACIFIGHDTLHILVRSLLATRLPHLKFYDACDYRWWSCH
jgi:hypothetical protein